MTTGTAVSATDSSSDGFVTDNLYLNNSTWDLWKCTGTDTWELQGNIEGATGATGQQGLPGENGQDGTDGTNGTNSYIWVRYSESADGTGFVATPTVNTTYVGFYTGNSDVAPTDKAEYTWSKFVGKDGVSGKDGNLNYYGTLITGNSTTPTVYETGIEYANIGDSYTNTTTFFEYRCVLAGEEVVAKWVYVGSKKGADGLGSGDMLKATYDTNSNGIVDNAEKLGGKLPSHYQPALANVSEEASEIADTDVMLVGAKKTLWSTIKSVLKTYFDTLYGRTTISDSDGDDITSTQLYETLSSIKTAGDANQLDGQTCGAKAAYEINSNLSMTRTRWTNADANNLPDGYNALGTNVINTPDNNTFVFIIQISITGVIFQQAFKCPGDMWFRARNSVGTWSNWRRI